MKPMPVIFAATGGPNQIEDAEWMEGLKTWGSGLPKPKAILMISAHWEEPVVTLGPTRTVPLTYDFSGFPPHYYRIAYPAPGAPALAERVRQLLGHAKIPHAEDPDRGLDHGAFLPLLAMFPKADVPVLQIAMPGLEPKPLFELGRALAPLRDEGVLIVAAGLFVHNFNAMDFGSIDHPATADSTVKWSAEFDAWVKDVLVRNDWDALLDYRARAPHVGRALPTHEHFAPKIVVAGAVAGKAVPVEFPITGFVYGTHTRRSVQLG